MMENIKKNVVNKYIDDDDNVVDENLALVVNVEDEMDQIIISNVIVTLMKDPQDNDDDTDTTIIIGSNNYNNNNINIPTTTTTTTTTTTPTTMSCCVHVIEIEEGKIFEQQNNIIKNEGEAEVESILYEEEEAPTTSASSITTGSVKIHWEDTFCTILKQAVLPFFIGGIGMVGAGFYLDYVKDWLVFHEIHQLFILIPALVGLKGNLEMTLASRLSTQANLGNMKNLKAKLHLTLGNLCLVQCQAIVLSSLASFLSLLIGCVLDDGHFNVFHGLVLFASSLATASLASFGLGIFTAFAVITSSSCDINPDNIAAPLAASLGDLVTLFCLSNISNYFHDLGDLDFAEPKTWTLFSVLGICFLIFPICLLLGWRSRSVRPLFKNGWLPIIIAVFVSSLAGCVLRLGMNMSEGIAVFQPVFCGIGGNIAAVQASRISTALHHKVPLGILPEGIRKWCGNPISSFTSNRGNSVAARALLVLAIPGHIIFFFVIQFIGSSHTAARHFIPFYIIAAVIQVILMLYTTELIVNLLWSKKKDPDSEAIPYLTAFGDIIGICLLGLAFGAFHWFYGIPSLA